MTPRAVGDCVDGIRRLYVRATTLADVYRPRELRPPDAALPRRRDGSIVAYGQARAKPITGPNERTNRSHVRWW